MPTWTWPAAESTRPRPPTDELLRPIHPTDGHTEVLTEANDHQSATSRCTYHQPVPDTGPNVETAHDDGPASWLRVPNVPHSPDESVAARGSAGTSYAALVWTEWTPPSDHKPAASPTTNSAT